MAISLYDHCTTTDWENIALRVSQISAALALVISIVALSLGTLYIHLLIRLELFRDLSLPTSPAAEAADDRNNKNSSKNKNKCKGNSKSSGRSNRRRREIGLSPLYQLPCPN